MTVFILGLVLAGSEPLVVQGFEDPGEWESENDSPREGSTEHVTQGEHSMRVDYTNKPVWSNVLSSKIPGDWSGFKYFLLDVYSTDEEPVGFGMWVRDKAQHKFEHSWVIGPGENTLQLDLDLMVKQDFELKDAVRLCLYKQCKQELVLFLDNMRLVKELPKLEAEPVRMPDENLLADGSFESLGEPDELGNPFDRWRARRWTGPCFLGRGKKGVKTGSSSAMLDGRGRCKIGYYSPFVRVSSPTRLVLSGWAQAKGLKKGQAGRTASVIVTDMRENVLPGGEVRLPEGTYGWRRFACTVEVPAGCKCVRVFLQAFGPGQVWFDDLDLHGADLGAPVGQEIAEAAAPGVYDPPVETEGPHLAALRAAAVATVNVLDELVARAKEKGVETLYAEVPLLVGRVALETRWDRPEHLQQREGYAMWIIENCAAAYEELDAVMEGRRPDLKVPPHPDFTKLRLSGDYFADGTGPRILFSMQYHSNPKDPLLRFFSPRDWYAYLPAVGATRYDFLRSPIWETYQAHPETHRVYDDGWCGHIIRDKYSAGGAERCVINLDSPKMREAIARSIEWQAGRRRIPRPGHLICNMGFEYSYVNYDVYTLDAFREWLREKHGRIEALNEVWKTELASFDDVTLPSYTPGVEEPNPAKHYDFGEFNLWRFTQYMKWAKGEIGKHVDLPRCTGGGSPFGARLWKQGIDEEALVREGVNDVWLSETGSRAFGTAIVMDLQRSFEDEPRLILDPEYHARADTIMLIILHGCSVIDYWWWPATAESFSGSSLAHSPTISLDEVATVVRTALDVRRLQREIGKLARSQLAAEVAILYPRSTLIQRHPGQKGAKTPYTLEVEKLYSAATGLDAPVTFASSRRVEEGKLLGKKLLIVPAARYVRENVFSRVVDFADSGGTVLVTPTSFVADEYSRRRDYLARLGVGVAWEELPEYLASKAVRGLETVGEYEFIQGPVSMTMVSKLPRHRLKGVGGFLEGVGLKAEGICQMIKTGGDARVLAEYEYGSPAVVELPRGEGRIIYSAAQLSPESSWRFLDGLYRDCGVRRPMRVCLDDGGRATGVEARCIDRPGGYLAYVHNLSKRPVKVVLSFERALRSAKELLRARELALSEDGASVPLELPALSTAIVELSTQ